MYIQLVEDVPKQLNKSIKIEGSSNYNKEVIKYYIPPLALIILEYLNSEIVVWRDGFISQKFRTFDNIIIDEGSALEVKSSTVIYFKYVEQSINKNIHIDWIDNYEHIESKKSNISKYDIDNLKNYQILYVCKNDVSFPLANGIYKIIPISNVTLNIRDYITTKNIPINNPTYIHVDIFRAKYEIHNITGDYVLRIYYLKSITQNVIKSKKIVNKNPLLN